jgi:dihydrodipicolinate synthase/N-acetylneuraminate lyase
MHLFTATRDMGGITGTKAALQLLGLPGGNMRRPRLALPESMWETVRQTMIDDIDLRTIEGL